MKTEEDEAFDDLARKQGMWGGGFQAKRQAAMDKVNAEFNEEYIKYRTAFPKGYTTQQVLPKDYTTQQRVPLVEYCTDYHCARDCGQPHDQKDMRDFFTSQPAHCQCPACKDGVLHASDCAVHTGPAYSLGPCDCGVAHDPDALTIAYQSGYHDGKKAALATREWNFCERCGKRTKDMFTIHTCTPPQGDA